MKIGLLLGLLACRPAAEDASAARALAPWPSDPQALLAVCETEPFPELQTTCRVQAAARLAARGQAGPAGDVCALVPAGTWREECHFRVGEELATTGQAVAAATSCGQAGWFARRCVTHAAWRLVVDDGLGPEADRSALEADAAELLSAVQASLAVHEDAGVAGEGRDAFRAAWGRAIYLGSGSADPSAAGGQGELGPALRTGWATEALRLLVAGGRLPDDAVPQLHQAWLDGVAITGPPTDQPPTQRYAPLQIGPHDQGLPHLPMYGGGLRLVGDSVDEDLRVAVLEAVYGHPAAGPEHFEPALADPSERVRWTAARLVALAAEHDLDGGSARLAALAADAPDPTTRSLLLRERTPPPAAPQR